MKRQGKKKFSVVQTKRKAPLVKNGSASSPVKINLNGGKRSLVSPIEQEVSPIKPKVSPVKRKVSGSKRRVSFKVKALKEIAYYQKSYNLLIPRRSFGRLAREIFQSFSIEGLRVSTTALECLQTSAEAYLVNLFEDSYLCALHANRRTLMVRDVRLARRIGGRPCLYV